MDFSLCIILYHNMQCLNNTLCSVGEDQRLCPSTEELFLEFPCQMWDQAQAIVKGASEQDLIIKLFLFAIHNF